MLYIDDVQISPRELAKRLGIDEKKYERIVKKPTFELDKSRKVKKRTINSPHVKKPTQGVLTSFWFDENGIKRRLRYAEAQIPKTEGGVMRYTYEPGRLNLDGSLVNFVNAPDKAFFMFLNPGNPTSPFADKTKRKFAYMDTIEKTTMEAANMTNIQRALTHATTMDEEELVLVAKGLKLLTSDDYEIEALRVKLQQYAINPATNGLYIKAMDDEMVRIEGRIRNMVDKKIFTISKRGSSRQWVWSQGARAGEYIGESIMNPSEDALQRLINYIKVNLGDYLYDLRNSTDIIQADRVAREVLAAEKQVPAAPVTQVPEHLAAVNADTGSTTTATSTGELALGKRLVSFDDFREYVGMQGYPKNSKLIKEFMTAVQEGAVTDDNVKPWLSKLFEKP
jgi:hypothetical protein